MAGQRVSCATWGNIPRAASTVGGVAVTVRASHFNGDGEGWLVTGRSIRDVSSEGHETCRLVRGAWVVRCG